MDFMYYRTQLSCRKVPPRLLFQHCLWFWCSVDGKTSAWLAVLPLCTHHFDLSATEFRDALAMRYQRPLLRMPATCDGCGAAFNLEHALDCRKGGLVIQRHNEIRDALGDLASIAFRNVLKEPIVKEANIRDGTPATSVLEVFGNLRQ